MLRVLAQRGSGCDPDTDSSHHGWVDHEYLLGNGHGHPGESVLVLCRVALQMFVAHINTGDELQMQHTSAVILKLHARIGIVPNENK